jgi:DNA invertase Pin-like site-specific DNA recombinase
MLIGYARVSKTEQNLDMQIDALRAAGCEKIFADKQSGATWDRKELQAAQSHLRAGDTLVVWKLDRLGRTVLQSVQFLNELHKSSVEFRSLTEGIDTNTSFGKFYFHMAAALAELERDRLIERTNAGLKSAKARGRQGGRKRKLSEDQEAHVLELLADGKRSQADVARLLKVSRPTISRLVERAAKLEPVAGVADSS